MVVSLVLTSDLQGKSMFPNPPPKAPENEKILDENAPEFITHLQILKRFSEDVGTKPLKVTATKSSKWGAVLRVHYSVPKAKDDEEYLGENYPEMVWLCWIPEGEKTPYVTVLY